MRLSRRIRTIKNSFKGIRRSDYFTRESWESYVGYRHGKIPEWNLSISPADYECLVFSGAQLDYIYNLSSSFKKPCLFLPINDTAAEEDIDAVKIYYFIIWDAKIYYDDVYGKSDISYKGISLIDNISYPVVGLDGEKGGLQKFIF